MPVHSLPTRLQGLSLHMFGCGIIIYKGAAVVDVTGNLRIAC